VADQCDGYPAVGNSRTVQAESNLAGGSSLLGAFAIGHCGVIVLAGMLEHVRDSKEIRAYGILATPGLIINGKLRCAGRVPTEKQLREQLLFFLFLTWR
jgi:hypothetical protein